ncbi:MAG: histidine phosphatase family protein [Crenarchaeota archaeon]|nr:MAG: histidine phosphatase family protein [Thermoproteota archaeon]RDJ33296.1 MAG: histidine phosphatase family protein [Thermoproteota archaeon]RDJ36200.1 MAG: histidine phosphatase family protein [Thermoproteota archaeon]RDJ38832.1 MAG: histidine phosphatase family protein [Thermoproteota archaeon]
MTSIIFLRHGQAKNNTERLLAGRTEGVPLTDTGIKQAESIAGFIKEMKVDHIYTSPIQRAKHTAEIVGNHNSIDPIVDERLIELDMGKFTGMKYDDIFSSHGNVFLKFYQGDVEIAHQGVETFAQVKSRVQSIVDHVISQHSGKNIVLVTHMDPIKAMISSVLGLSPERMFELIVANASINVFKEYDGKLSLKAINVMNPSRFDQDW